MPFSTFQTLAILGIRFTHVKTEVTRRMLFTLLFSPMSSSDLENNILSDDEDCEGKNNL
jgi:hypothetical protein